MPIVASELASALSEGAGQTVGEWSVRTAGWPTAAVTIIRRVTPVLPAERGVPPAPPRLGATPTRYSTGD